MADKHGSLEPLGVVDSVRHGLQPHFRSVSAGCQTKSRHFHRGHSETMRHGSPTIISGIVNRCGAILLDRGRLLRLARATAALCAVVIFADRALSQDAILTVQGTGTASKYGAGAFYATLPDGSQCSGTFSGGKISLFGRSEAARSTATCTKAGTTRTARAVVSRRLNGSPEQATLTFNDGTKVLVLIPRAEKSPPPAPPAPAAPAQ